MVLDVTLMQAMGFLLPDDDTVQYSSILIYCKDPVGGGPLCGNL